MDFDINTRILALERTEPFLKSQLKSILSHVEDDPTKAELQDALAYAVADLIHYADEHRLDMESAFYKAEEIIHDEYLSHLDAKEMEEMFQSAQQFGEDIARLETEERID